MGTVDWVILGVIVASALVSIMRGFVKEALSLVNLVVAIMVSRMFCLQVSELLVEYVAIPSIRLAIAVVLLFVVSLFVGSLITRLVSQGVKISGLGSTDSFLGMCFGLARGVLVVWIILVALFYLTPMKDDSWWRESALIPHFMGALDWIAPMIREQGGQLIDYVGEEGI